MHPEACSPRFLHASTLILIIIQFQISSISSFCIDLLISSVRILHKDLLHHPIQAPPPRRCCLLPFLRLLPCAPAYNDWLFYCRRSCLLQLRQGAYIARPDLCFMSTSAPSIPSHSVRYQSTLSMQSGMRYRGRQARRDGAGRGVGGVSLSCESQD